MAESFRIYRFKRIDSTNRAAFRYADEGAPPGSVFVAEYQTQGRGKWGRHWVSPAGKDLLFSILLCPRWKASRASGVTQIACRSVAKVLEKRFKLHPTFKRPNDILIQGRKVCGLLVESKGRPNGDLDSLVIGVGINVNSQADELVPGATSLLEETGREHSRRLLLRSLTVQLKKDLGAWYAE